MSDNYSNNNNDKPLFNRFQAFGATLRQSAQDVAAKAAAQVNELNAKVAEVVVIAPPPTTTTSTSSSSSLNPSQQQQQQQHRPSTTNISSSMTPPLHTIPSIGNEDDRKNQSQLPTTDSPEPSISTGSVVDNEPASSSVATSSSITDESDSNKNIAAAVEKKDLLELLQKMNHKIKALTATRQQLSEQVESLSQEKKLIHTFVKEEILNESIGDEAEVINTPTDQVVQQLQVAWRQQEEQHQSSIQILQKEFHTMQQQQQQHQQEQHAKEPSTDTDTARWEAEKKELLQKHQDEIIQLRQQLNEVTATTNANSESSTSTDEIERIKQEAAQQIQSFKEKVAVARKAEIQKVKTETATMAKKIMETKLNEQKELYEQQIKELQQQPTPIATVTPDETMGDTVKQLEKQIEQMQLDHSQQMEQSKLQYSQQLETIENQLKTTTKELEVVRQQMDERTDHETRRNEDHIREVNEMKSLIQEKEVEITKLQSNTSAEITSQLEQQKNDMMEQFQKEKEQIRLDYQQKWKEATVANRNAAAQQLQDAVDTVTKECNEKIEQLRKEYDDRNAQEIQQVRNESDQVVREAVDKANTTWKLEIDQLRTTLESQMQVLQVQLDEKSKLYDAARNDAQKLQLELDNLTSHAKQQQQQSKEIAAADSENDHETKQNSDTIEAMQKDIEQMAHSRDEALFKVIDLQNELKQLSDTKNRELQSLQHLYDTVVSEHSVTLSSVKATHESAIADLTNQLKTNIVELDQSKLTITNLMNEISQQKSLISDLETKFDAVRSNVTADNDVTKAEIEEFRLQNQELQNQIDQLLKVQLDMTEQTKVLDGAQNELNDMKKLQETSESTILQLQNELRTAQEQLETKNGIQSNEEIESLYQNKILALEDKHTNEIQKLISDHKVEVEKLRDEYETRMVSKDIVTEMEQVTKDLQEQIVAIQKGSEEEKANMRKAMESHIDTLTIQFKEKLETAKTKAAEELNVLQKSVQEKDGKLKQLLEKLTSLTATSTKLRDDNVALKSKFESEINTQKELRGQLNSLKKQFDDTVSNSSATASSLLKQQESLEKEKSNLEQQVKSLRAELQSKSNKVEELSGKLHALSDNLNAITKGQKAMDEKLEQASKQEAKLHASELEVHDLREQIGKLKLEMTKYVTTIEKLQTEKDTNERNHGQRTAIVSMLEAQLSDMNDKYSETNAKLEAALYEVSQKSEVIQSDAERIKRLEQELDEAKNMVKRNAEALAVAQKANDTKGNKMIESLQKELQATKQQMVRKSAAAQQLIQQREAECAELRKTNQALQNEVDKGSYSDRRIFELAAKQSSRESYQVSEIEVRDSIIDRLKEALLERDGDLASAEKHAHEVECQIEELFRIRRREDVNIDYLKSIVVQYLSLPPGSTERAGLLPVLATLLQFDDADYRIIEEGKNKVSWWGSSVVPKLINAPTNSAGSNAVNNGAGLHRPISTGSAEVSVSSSAAIPTVKRTSLQF